MGEQVGGCFQFRNGSMEIGGTSVFSRREWEHGKWRRMWQDVSHLRIGAWKIGAQVGGCFQFEIGSMKNLGASGRVFPI